jgi:hypothetical protein
VRIRFLPAAVDELEKNALWLDQHAGHRGSEFLDAFAEAVEQIQVRPQYYPRFEAALELVPHLDIRRIVLKPFAHLLLFELRKDVILLVAVMHPSQQADYWVTRVS